MTHETLQDLVFKARDGEANPAEAAAARDHLAACPECRRDLEAWDRAARALMAAPTVEPSENFVSRVMEGLPVGWRERLRDYFSPMPLRWAAAGAFAAVLFLAYPALRRPSAPPAVPAAAGADWVAELAYAEPDGGGDIGTAIERYFL